jgi:hypothetical protein
MESDDIDDKLYDAINNERRGLSWNELNEMEEKLEKDVVIFIDKIKTTETYRTKFRVFALLKLTFRFIKTIKERSITVPEINLTVVECNNDQKKEMFGDGEVGEIDFELEHLFNHLHNPIFGINKIWNGYLQMFESFTRQVNKSNIKFPMFRLFMIQSSFTKPTYSNIVKPIKQSPKNDLVIVNKPSQISELSIYRCLQLSYDTRVVLIEKWNVIDPNIVDIKIHQNEKFIIMESSYDPVILIIYKNMNYTKDEMAQLEKLKLILTIK